MSVGPAGKIVFQRVVIVVTGLWGGKFEEVFEAVGYVLEFGGYMGYAVDSVG